MYNFKTLLILYYSIVDCLIKTITNNKFELRIKNMTIYIKTAIHHFLSIPV